MVAKGLAKKKSPPAGPANHGGGEVVQWPSATVQSFEMLGNALSNCNVDPRVLTPKLFVWPRAGKNKENDRAAGP